ncbi:cyclic lactone autoinducer peptide [Geosporobacter ferrireducens]|nr:cyclic lactone autoinducer peptide [Geosporobacter ferrireducens]
MLRYLKSNSLRLLTAFALLIGTTVTINGSAVWTHQPKCPEELLK